MPQYMLLLHDDKTLDGHHLSPEEMQKALEKYLAWRKRTFVVDGRRLREETGRLLRKTHEGMSVTDGPFSEGKEIMGGYFTIEAASFEHATELFKDHPHLDFGTIEIRELFAPPK